MAHYDRHAGCRESTVGDNESVLGDDEDAMEEAAQALREAEVEAVRPGKELADRGQLDRKNNDERG